MPTCDGLNGCKRSVYAKPVGPTYIFSSSTVSNREIHAHVPCAQGSPGRGLASWRVLREHGLSGLKTGRINPPIASTGLPCSC